MARLEASLNVSVLFGSLDVAVDVSCLTHSSTLLLYNICYAMVRAWLLGTDGVLLLLIVVGRHGESVDRVEPKVGKELEETTAMEPSKRLGRGWKRNGAIDGSRFTPRYNRAVGALGESLYSPSPPRRETGAQT